MTPKKYWIRVEPDTGNPWHEGKSVCWSFYEGDRPAYGYWIEVVNTGKVNKPLSELTEEEKQYSAEFRSQVENLKKEFKNGH